MEAETIYFTDRQEWRNWLEKNFEKKNEIWLEFPKKETGRKRISYNDAVEEALCFGWIDSIAKSLDKETTIQRFSKRRKNSSWSQPNKERLKWLSENRMIHPSVMEVVEKVLQEQFTFPDDIIHRLKEDQTVWDHYQNMPESYKRIRIAYIEAAKNRPVEYEKRLNNFIEKTRANKKIMGYGGVEKYY
jgi:uncharacterized protein YdeI (YjbR/CyaY-like superfamily)